MHRYTLWESEVCLFPSRYWLVKGVMAGLALNADKCGVGINVCHSVRYAPRVSTPDVSLEVRIGYLCRQAPFFPFDRWPPTADPFTRALVQIPGHSVTTVALGRMIVGLGTLQHSTNITVLSNISRCRPHIFHHPALHR
jgi:hypothetical protein